MTHQNPQTTTKTAPGMIMVKFRVNRSRAEALLNAGVRKNHYNVGAITERRVQQAHETGQSLGPLRKDAVGNRQPDTGVQIFKKDETQNTCVKSLIANMQGDDYTRTHVQLTQKEGDNMFILWLIFQKNGEQFTQLSEVAEALIKEIVGKTYQHVYVWVNPNDTATVNANVIQTDKSVETTNLHFSTEDGFWI